MSDENRADLLQWVRNQTPIVDLCEATEGRPGAAPPRGE